MRKISILDKRAIEKLYGDQGSNIFQLLLKRPSQTVELILNRMKSKLTEWKEDMEETWRLIARANHMKSLDHFGASWKNVDSSTRRRPRGLFKKLQKFFETHEKRFDTENINSEILPS